MKALRKPLQTIARPRIKAGLIVVAGNLLGAGAAFAAAIVAARALPIDQFAAFGVGLAVNSLAVQFADFGLGAISVAERTDSATPAVARVKLKALALHRARTAIVVCLMVTAVTLVLPPLSPYRDAAVVGAAGGVFGSTALFFVWSLQGEHNFVAAASIQSLQGLLRLALVGGCVVVGMESAQMMIGYAIIAPAIAAVAAGLLLFVRTRRHDDEAVGETGPSDGAAAASGDIDVERRRVIAIAGVLAAMVLNGDVLLLTILANAHDVAVYAAAWRFSSGMLLINTAIGSAMLPFIVRAADAWVEAKHLVRLGLLVSVGWLVLVPVMAVVGPALLGGAVGDDVVLPLIVLAIAFAMDGFYFVIFQIYMRVRRERVLLVAMAMEFVIMVSVTVLLRDQGALAPALGQLAARVVVCVFIAAPIVLAALGKCSWFREENRGDKTMAPEPLSLSP